MSITPTAEFEIGDIALVRGYFKLDEVSRQRAVWRGNGWERLDSGVWCRPGDAIDAHRLAVIDPEDRHDVERLADLIQACSSPSDSHCEADQCGSMSCWAGRLQHALREFLTAPPKPEEPLGWLAVARDREGELWVRTGWDGGMDKPWQRQSTHRHWDAVEAVKVVNEGVLKEASNG